MNQAIRDADEALSLVKDVFVQLDFAQRTARGLVERYATVLPDRARTSGLVPRHRTLDETADALMSEYLMVMDTFPLAPKMRPEAVRAALQAFRFLEPRLKSGAADLEQFVNDYDAEFQRVGREVARYQREKDAANAAVERATELWQGLRAKGFESRLADEGLAKARVAGRAVEAWVPERGLEELPRTTALVKGFVEDVEKAAEEFPKLVARAQRRAPALHTRIEAISTRAVRLPDDLGALRREFSSGNWADLETNEALVQESVLGARSLIKQFQALLTDQQWDDALVGLEQAEAALARADEAVDGPRNRLLVLRAFKDAPAPLLNRARFAIRDAQMLVMRGPGGSTSIHAQQLDALALRLAALDEGLEGVHPNYWAVVTELERVHEDVKAVVGRFRGAPR